VPGTKWYELFPHQHVLKLDVTVSDGAVRFAYTVDNTQGEGPVPFGFAYHPWFLYQGARANTYLTIPASHWMEAEELLPTGKLVPLAGTKFDLRQPRALEGFVIDDVYYGLAPQQPTVIDFRDVKLKLELAASADFTHLVVYTPQEPWFCVENQTCSTDAHNLFARGLKKESHLQIVEPGKSHSGYAEFRFKPY
jgi:aldose 1-epimerase